VDLRSSNQHRVKPWFYGKLDFSVPVKDLKKLGFPLLGGRVDYLNNRSVAALVYLHRRHFINVFVWPAANPADKEPRTQTRQGYHLMHWTKDGLDFWAVSDLNETELAELVGLLRS
jgi:anti-sigma factor RsiW